MVMSTILETRNLAIGYDNQLFSNINFKINRGEVVGIIGKNGIGKSTLLRTLMRIIPAKDGEILIDEKNINSLDTNQLAQKIAVVLTEKIPIAQFSVYEILALGRFPHSNWLFQLNENDHKIIENVIETTKLETILHQKANQLSDGMLQKVMIARALVQDTPIIILDEPTTFLDLENTFQIFELLKKIAQEQQKTIIFSTHQLEIALQICNQIIAISNQEIVMQSPKQLIENEIIQTIFNTEKIKFNPVLMKFEYGF